MKRQLSLFAAAVVLLFLAAPAFAQFTAVHGKVTDKAGQPLAGAQVQFVSKDTGRKYSLKTDKKGEYYSLGIQPGVYTISISQNGQLLLSNVQKKLDLSAPNGVNEIPLDLAKEAAEAGTPPSAADLAKMTPEQQKAYEQKVEKTMTPEERKQYEQKKAENEKAEKYNAGIKVLNAKLQEAAADMEAKNFPAAVTVLKDAVATDPSHDLVWGRLGDAYMGAKQFAEAADAYQHAVQIIQQAPPEKQNKQNLAAYENQMGSALAQTGKVDEAIAAYNKAASDDPASAARVFFNEGAIMTNVGSRTTDPAKRADQLKAANDAFDKAIAADPKYAEAYFQKGANGVNMATMDKNGKTVVPPGTAEAFQKYLEVAPTGPHADEAKQLLAALGEQIQTSYGTKGKKK